VDSAEAIEHLHLSHFASRFVLGIFEKSSFELFARAGFELQSS
jgi:hypothetical protein